MEHRTVFVGGLMLRATHLDGNAHQVRVHPSVDAPYDRMTGVIDKGETLILIGWLGTPLSIDQYREAARALFPAAHWVEFQRLEDDGFRNVRLSVRR